MRSLYRILSISAIALMVCGTARAQEKYLHISVVDLQENPIEFVELTLRGKSSNGVTESNGKARIRLAPETQKGVEVELRITGKPKGKDYIFIQPWDGRVSVPPFSDESQNAVKIVLEEPGSPNILKFSLGKKALASEIIYKESPGYNADQSSERRREAALDEVSHKYKLPTNEIIRAIELWGVASKDPFEKAQADYIAKDYAKASAGFAKSIEIRLDARKKATGELFDAYSSYGRSLSQEGKYRESVEAYKEALELRKDDPVTLIDLGLTSLRAGKYEDASLYLDRAQEPLEKALGADHRPPSTILDKLALIYDSLGEYVEAELLYKRALAIREKALGADHPSTATSLDNLAGLYDSQRKYVEAEPLYRRALAIREKSLGADHPSTATSLNNLALLYASQEKYVEAEPLYKRALAIREKALGANHRDTAASLNNLAGLYESQGKYVEAEPLYQRALAISEKALGANHPDTATILNNLALLYSSQGKYGEAEPLYKRALAIREKALGAKHPNVAATLNSLAVAYREQGKYAEAEPLFRRGIAIYEKAAEPEHPEVGRNLWGLAKLYKAQGNYKEAEAQFKKALAIFDKKLRSDDPRLAVWLPDYADLLRKTNREEEAAKLEARAKEIREKTKSKEN